MYRFAYRSATLLALCLGALPAFAQSSFYGGDPYLFDALGADVNTAIDRALAYDDFTLGTGGTVTQVFGNFGTTLTPSEITGLYCEIRSGVSEGDGGTLLFSGTLAPTIVATGDLLFGLYDMYRVSGTPTGVYLDPGTYWMALGLVDSGQGRAFVATTEGQNGIGGPLLNGNSFFDSPPGYDFVSTTFPDLFLGHFDLSIGIDTQPVPEPATLAALGLSSLALLRRRKG